MEDSLICWLLVVVCAPHCIRNPYLVAKIIEVLFVINPGIQSRTENLHSRVMSHPISITYLPSYLMKFYTGMFHNDLESSTTKFIFVTGTMLLLL